MPSLEFLPRRAALFGMAAALMSLGVAEAADAGSNPPPPRSGKAIAATFATPAEHALVTTDAVPVRIGVGSQVSKIRVYADNEDISRYFARHRDTFTARLPRRLLKPGTNRLLVQATAGTRSGGADSVSFMLGSPAPGLMRVASGSPAASGLTAGPTDTRGYVPAAGAVPVRLHSATPTYARLSVNGRQVADLRGARQLVDHSWLVSLQDGLRAGRNVLVAEAWDSTGGYASRRWTITVDGSRPLAEAGPREEVVAPNRWTVLDGSESRATRSGAKLSYAWQVVSSPSGSKPQLLDPTSAKPRIKTDMPGVYQVALRTTQSTPGARGGGAGSASKDVITLDSVPPIGAQGLYIDTGLFGQTSKLQGPFTTLYVEGQGFTYSTGGNPDNWVQLDETTLAVIASGNHTQVTPKPGTITIGQWMGTNVNDVSWNTTSDAFGSQVWIGTKLVASNHSPNSPGSDVGNPTTNLHGWIQPASSDSAGDATWVGSDMLQVKTRSATDSPSQNTMEINGSTYRQTLPSGSNGGYQLVVLDHNGDVIANNLYAMTGNASADATTENNLANVLLANTDQSSLLLEGFGTLPAIASNTNLGNVIQSIGGRADVVDRFNGKTDSTGGVYGLISGPSSTGEEPWGSGGRTASEASYERTQANGSLTALMVRDSTADGYIPFTTDSGAPDVTGQNRYDLLPMIYAPPTDWTNWIRNSDGTLSAPTSGQAAAYSDLLADVVDNGWAPSKPLCPTAPDAIRGYYCDTDATQLETLAGRIDTLTFDAGKAGSRYTQDDWNTVQRSIYYEIGDVANIRSAIADYQALFGTSSIAGAVNATAIGDAVKAQIKQTTTTTTSAQLDNVVGALTDMASVISDVGPEMTFISGAFALDSTLLPDTSPDPILDSQTVTQDTAATTLVAAYQKASADLSKYGDYLVSDPVKLQAAARYFAVNDPPTSDSNSAFVHAAEYATQQWLWGTMLAPAYTAWVLPSVDTNNPDCSSPKGAIGHPWSNNSPSGTWPSSIGVGSKHTSWNWFLGYDSQASGNWGFVAGNWQWLSATGLPGTITNPLFGQPVDPNAAPSATSNAGAIMPYFALNYLPIKFAPEMPQQYWGQNPNHSGCQPD
jgi:hypothetical protein